MGTDKLSFEGDRTIAHAWLEVTSPEVTWFFPLTFFPRTFFPVLFFPYFFFRIFFRTFSPRTISPYFFPFLFFPYYFSFSSPISMAAASCNNVAPVTNLCLGRATTRSHSSQWSNKKKLQLKHKNSLFTLQTFHYNYYWWSQPLLNRFGWEIYAFQR